MVFQPLYNLAPYLTEVTLSFLSFLENPSYQYLFLL